MNERANAFDQTEEEILTYTISDEALEAEAAAATEGVRTGGFLCSSWPC